MREAVNGHLFWLFLLPSAPGRRPRRWVVAQALRYWVPPAPFPLVPPSHSNIPPRSLAAARHGIWMLRLQSPR